VGTYAFIHTDSLVGHVEEKNVNIKKVAILYENKH